MMEKNDVSRVRGIETESITVQRTARIATFGPDGPGARELWYVMHGYGGLAEPFLEDFAVIDDGTRIVVAPEALSRFYEGDVQSRIGHKDAKIGASWMTREARDAEIADYIAYFNTVHQLMLARLGVHASVPKVTVLGFSQGAAAASRWVASGSVDAARLVIWGSSLAPELDIESAGTPLRKAETVIVIGTTDVFATPKIVERERARLNAANFPFRFVSFQGGHRIDDDTLRALAGMSTDQDATGAL
jgi:predicted esterase